MKKKIATMVVLALTVCLIGYIGVKSVQLKDNVSRKDNLESANAVTTNESKDVTTEEPSSAPESSSLPDSTTNTEDNSNAEKAETVKSATTESTAKDSDEIEPAMVYNEDYDTEVAAGSLSKDVQYDEDQYQSAQTGFQILSEQNLSNSDITVTEPTDIVNSLGIPDKTVRLMITQVMQDKNYSSCKLISYYFDQNMLKDTYIVMFNDKEYWTFSQLLNTEDVCAMQIEYDD